MADTRIIHRSAGEGERSNQLTDFEFRVWVQYILSADDYGVMLRSPLPLQNGSKALRKKSVKVSEVAAALERIIAVGLVSTFEHHGEQYVWQPDWQDWQKVSWPRKALLPAPSLRELAEASFETRELFRNHSSINQKEFVEVFGEFLKRTSKRVRQASTTNTHTSTHTGVDLPEGVQGEGDRSASDVPPAWGHGTRRGSHGGHDALIDGRQQRRHGEHFGPGCDIGLCLLPAIQSDHRARLSKSNDCGPDGRTREQFYRDTVAAEHRRLDSGGQPCGDTPWEFWNKRFAEWLGVSPNGARSATKGNRTVAAGRRVDEAYAAGALPNPFGADGAVPPVPALTGRGE